MKPSLTKRRTMKKPDLVSPAESLDHCHQHRSRGTAEIRKRKTIRKGKSTEEILNEFIKDGTTHEEWLQTAEQVLNSGVERISLKDSLQPILSDELAKTSPEGWEPAEKPTRKEHSEGSFKMMAVLDEGRRSMRANKNKQPTRYWNQVNHSMRSVEEQPSEKCLKNWQECH